MQQAGTLSLLERLFPRRPLPEGLPRSRYARLRRSTLVYLRWIAVAGQTIALFVIATVFGYQFPIYETAAVVGAAALFNVVVTFSLPLDRSVDDREATLQLGFDVLQLAMLLYLTGGVVNPFELLLLAPVVTGATTLNRATLATLMGLVAVASAFLVVQSHTLPGADESGFSLPLEYRWGIWTALMTGMLFTSLYAWRAASGARRMSAALAATELVLAREQKLVALGGLAAAAAHELGTPLATIQVTAKELARETEEGTPEGDDARLILDQARRCRDILAQLSSRGEEGDLVHDRVTLSELIDEAIEPYIESNKSFAIVVEGPAPFAVERPDPDISIPRRPELIYGLRNLVENAVSFAEEEVTITAKTTLSAVTISIADDGPGFDPLVRARLGEPYISSRPDRNKKAGGLGLGVFIAKTLIERTGGSLRFANQGTGGGGKGGAIITLYWPKETLQAA